MSDTAFCPGWLQQDWQALRTRHQAGRLPHALLIGGARGIGKRVFADFAAQSLLCLAPDDQGQACGSCDACSQFSVGSHPDYRKLLPEGASQTVRIDAVRELNDWLQLTADRNSYKLAVIDSADTMNRSAANALLKTLEEPPSAALILLIADRPAALPATVLSRCQRLLLRLRDRQAALDWLSGQEVVDAEGALSRAGDAPYRAVAEQDDAWVEGQLTLLKAWEDLILHRASIGRIVDSVSAQPAAECLACFSRLTSLVARHRAGLPVSVDERTRLAVETTAGVLSSDNWFTVYARIGDLHRIDSASFKTQAVLEGLFADIRLRIQG